jgi:hypothetical protein
LAWAQPKHPAIKRLGASTAHGGMHPSNPFNALRSVSALLLCILAKHKAKKQNYRQRFNPTLKSFLTQNE